MGQEPITFLRQVSALFIHFLGSFIFLFAENFFAHCRAFDECDTYRPKRKAAQKHADYLLCSLARGRGRTANIVLCFVYVCADWQRSYVTRDVGDA